jgi:hypothetical protein
MLYLAWRTRRALVIVLVLLAPGFQCRAARAQPAGAVEVELNGLKIVLDQKSGSLLRLSYPGIGTMLEPAPGRGSLVDLAYPIPEFEPLRLAPRFSEGAEIRTSPGAVEIAWKALGPSRRVELAGHVAVAVRLRQHEDGRSIVMSCTVENRSPVPVRQVLFPDLAGLRPFAGERGTLFRTAGFAERPFERLKRPEHGAPFFATDAAAGAVEYRSGGYFGSTPMIAKWMDFGGLNGGFSLFRQRWSFEPDKDDAAVEERVRLHLSELDGTLRLLCVHSVNLAQGATWKSEDYLLTPHRGGWAAGIAPYRKWVEEHLKRAHPVPDHVRNGLGFRTIFMSQNYPQAPGGDHNFRCADLPMLARESKEHGIDELCLWDWSLGLQVPIPPPFPQVGSERDLAAAVAECKRIGVNVNLFISVMGLANPSAKRYGLTPPEDGGWTYHTELIPQFRPDYGKAFLTAYISPTDPRWQREVLESCRHLIDLGCPSIGWDQFAGYPTQPGLFSLVSEVRKLARQRDPQSTLNGESVSNIDNDAHYLDYTWDWFDYPATGDPRPFASAYPAPRLNINIDRSPRDVRLGFMDNLYLNVMPSKPEGTNGSGLIKSYPALARALKQCARLRQQFLPYFTDGIPVGDCLLSEESASAHVSAYVLPGKALLIAFNEGAERPISLACNLAAWIESAGGKYEARSYDLDAQPLGIEQLDGPDWRTQTPKLGQYELVVIEIKAR